MKKLINILKISKKELYNKYVQYNECLKNGYNQLDASCVVFSICPTKKNREILFYLIVGLESMKDQVEHIQENWRETLC